MLVGISAVRMRSHSHKCKSSTRTGSGKHEFVCISMMAIHTVTSMGYLQSKLHVNTINLILQAMVHNDVKTYIIVQLFKARNAQRVKLLITL